MKITSQDIQEAEKRIKSLVNDAYTYVIKNKSCLSNVVENKKFAKKHGLEYLGSGAYRIAFRYKNIVVKVTRYENDTWAIMEEVDIWNAIRKDRRTYIKALFNPILNHGLINITFKKKTVTLAYSFSPYVTPLEGNTGKISNVYNEIRNFADLLFPDCHIGNYGIIGGLPVIIDYQNDEIEMYSPEYTSERIKSLLRKHYKKMKKLATVAA